MMLHYSVEKYLKYVYNNVMFQNENKLISKNSAHIIVFGNEKGGTGKSTVAMHVAVGLLRLGYRVGTIDLDNHQGTLTQYIENRKSFSNTHEVLPIPEHIHIKRVEHNNLMQQKLAEQELVEQAINKLKQSNDYIIIDTPGSNTYMSIVGHSFADTIVTPINDSFVDLDLLARFDKKARFEIKPNVYTRMIWDLRNQREKRDDKFVDWVVMRNRLAHLYSRNKNEVGVVLDRLSKSLGFRLASGFGERVVFRELFLEGRTLLDIKETGENKLSISNIAARQEVRHLIKTILPEKSAMTMSLLRTA